MKMLTAPLGGFIGAILGGILWAKYIQWTGTTAGFVALGIGLPTGAGMLLSSTHAIEPDAKAPWLIVSITAAIFAIIGIFIGKYLDVQWNALAHITEQLMAEQKLTLQQAKPIAQTLLGGSSKWELMQQRMDRFDLVYGGAAALIAFYIPSMQRLRNYFYRN